MRKIISALVILVAVSCSPAEKKSVWRVTVTGVELYKVSCGSDANTIIHDSGPKYGKSSYVEEWTDNKLNGVFCNANFTEQVTVKIFQDGDLVKEGSATTEVGTWSQLHVNYKNFN